MPADRTQAKQLSKELDPKHSGTSMRHSCQKTWEDTVENGQQAKWIPRYNISFKKTASHRISCVYTGGSFTKDQSWWCFTVTVSVKQGATTIHEDNAAYEVSPSSLTMEVEAIAHAFRWIALRGDSQTTHAIILTDSMSLLQKVEWKAQTVMCPRSTCTFEKSCGCTVLDMPESKEMTEQVDWRAKQPSQVAYFLEELKC